MKTLYVLYDPDCAFCLRCREWLAAEPAFIELKFVPQRSAEAADRFPGIEQFQTAGELTVVSDDGAVYQGSNAFIMCLHALQEYRELAARLAQPTLAPFARKAFELISNHRQVISNLKWIKKTSDDHLAETLRLHSHPAGGNTTLPCLLKAKGPPPIIP